MKCEKCGKPSCVMTIDIDDAYVCDECLMGDITQNLSCWEFSCKCGCGLDIISFPLVHRLQVIRDILGVKIIINSGCRCWDHHVEIYKKLGLEPPKASYHLSGNAADWTVEDGKILTRAAKMLVRWSGGFHYYKDQKFIHTDIGLKRRW